MTEFTPIKLPRVRFTLLDSCGAYDTGSCATWATNGSIEIAGTGQMVDRVENTLTNGDDEIIGVSTSAPKLKWIEVALTMTGFDPNYIGWLTGNSIVYDDASTPAPIGFTNDTNAAALSNFALEGWSRLVGPRCSGGAPVYGYVLYPWLTEGVCNDLTINNGLASCVITARTEADSPWGVGPYPVVKSEATATLGYPTELFSSFGTDAHRLLITTKLAYPLATTACGPVYPTLTVVDTGGVGVYDAEATLPTATGAIPGVIDWGDSNVDVVTTGPTATHTYASAATFTVTYRSSAQSGPAYVGTVTTT